MRPVAAQSATGTSTTQRRFPLPIELGGMSMSINGVACGLYYIDRRTITFVVPRGLTPTTGTNTYPLVINNRGIRIRSTLQINPAQPDLFSTTNGEGGRAIAFNVTNRVFTREPFTVMTVSERGGTLVPTQLRLIATGVNGLIAGAVSVRVRDKIYTASSPPIEDEMPGFYRVEFTFDSERSLQGAGDVPVVIIVTEGGQILSSRLDDTAPRIFLL
jgi:hypothetical protein